MDWKSIFLYSHPKWRYKTIALRTELLTCSSLQQGLGARSFGWKDTPFLWQSEGTCRLVVFELWWPVIKEKSMDTTWISEYWCPVAWQCQDPQIKHIFLRLNIFSSDNTNHTKRELLLLQLPFLTVTNVSAILQLCHCTSTHTKNGTVALA